jgi:hypothetical protein
LPLPSIPPLSNWIVLASKQSFYFACALSNTVNVNKTGIGDGAGLAFGGCMMMRPLFGNRWFRGKSDSFRPGHRFCEEMKEDG